MSVARERGDIQRVFLNVHVANEEALAFYDRNGFTRGPRVEGYYQRISPPDAFFVYKDL